MDLIDLTLRAKRLREEQNILIFVYNSASGYLWAASKVDSGTDLGWSNYKGNCPDTGAFTTYEIALNNAVTLCEKCSLEQFEQECNNASFHWGKYVTHIQQKQ